MFTYKKERHKSCIIEGKVEERKIRGRPLTSSASEIMKFVGGSLADTFHKAVARRRVVCSCNGHSSALCTC